MTRFFVKWWADLSRTPASPQEAAKFRFKMLEMVRADLSTGKITEWGSFSNGRDGYLIIDGTEQDVFSTMFKWMPTIMYEVYPVLSADDYIASVKGAVEAM
jgi:hypothetical protein